MEWLGRKPDCSLQMMSFSLMYKLNGLYIFFSKILATAMGQKFPHSVLSPSL